MAVYSAFGLPGSEFAATEAADIGTLGVNLFTAQIRGTQRGKIRKIIDEKVYPSVYYADAYSVEATASSSSTFPTDASALVATPMHTPSNRIIILTRGVSLLEHCSS